MQITTYTQSNFQKKTCKWLFCNNIEERFLFLWQDLMQPRLASNLLSIKGQLLILLTPLCAEITIVLPPTSFVQAWGSNLGLHESLASILLTKLLPQPHLSSFSVFFFSVGDSSILLTKLHHQLHFFFFFCFSVLGIELQASYMIGKGSKFNHDAKDKRITRGREVLFCYM